ncbi:RmlC-like cupins superfamily protein [Tanacetum coccineum]|uniref:RmlC-like cupins superfamily protein n=1 Tax=Tanacetum coccineum TaxID=301880 RepID=A0ABQ5AQL4_9ASTR
MEVISMSLQGMDPIEEPTSNQMMLLICTQNLSDGTRVEPLIQADFHPFPNTPLNSPAPSPTTTDETNHSNPTPNTPQSPLTSPNTSTNTTTTSPILTESSQSSPSTQQEQHQTEPSPSQTEPSLEPSFTQTTTPPPSNPPPQPRHSTRQHTIPLKWVDAMSKELLALEANNTWTITSLPPNKTLIGSKWVFRIKCNSDGSIERFNGRLVAKGFNQKEGKDYNETFAPVAKMVTLHKSLYGLKQANRQWFTKLTTFLTELGFTQSYVDTSLLTYKKNADFLALVIYVDDILLAGNNTTLINHFKQQLDSKFSIKDLGNLNYYLGIEFLRNKTGITMTQRKYALELLHTAGILDVKPSHIPIDLNIKLNDIDGDLLPDASLYRTLVGKLFYLIITRPDLSYAAHCLSQFSHSPRTPHFDALIKVLRYIKLCPGQGLHFPTHSSLQLKAYCDSDWANCPTTRRSITGFCIFLGPCLISWQSKKQSVVARSSTEVEYRALADCTCEITWLQSLLLDLQVLITKPVLIMCSLKPCATC